MIKHLLKIAWRNLIRNKRNSIIIITSLVIAFSFTNLLVSFISYEVSTDSFHGKKDRIYRLYGADPMGSDRRTRSILNETREYVAQNYSEVEEACNVTTLDQKGVVLTKDNQRFRDIMVLSTNPSFFRIFGYPFLEGDPMNALSRNDGIILTEETAQKLFGSPPYTNKVIELQQDTIHHLMEVTGVLSEIPGQTQLKFDALVSNIKFQNHGMPGSAFLLMKPGTDINRLIVKMNENKDVPGFLGTGKSRYYAESFASSYFNAEKALPYERSQSKRFMWICWMIVVLICFAAGFNFINLFIIGISNRGKELGIRKIQGATKGQIGASAYIEIGLYVLIAFLLSIPVTVQLLPYFNGSFNARLNFDYITSPEVIGLILLLVLFISVVLAVYLAQYLKKLDMIPVLQNRTTKKLKINRSLFTAQFAITVGMIICSTIVIRQMYFIKNTPLGFNRHLMELQAPTANHHKELKVLKNKLLQYPEFNTKVALSNGNPLSGGWKFRLELDDGTFYTPISLSGDNNLPNVLHLDILTGEPFHGKGSGYLVNEKLVKDLNIKAPIGKPLPGSSKPNSIISGVVKNFNVKSLKHEIPPYFISYNEAASSLLIDISDSELGQLLPLIEESWNETYPENPFEYKLINDELLAKHEEDIRFIRILIAFTLASIFISCFGLYGIAAFTTVQRTKEIGIRKVLGASVVNIMGLLAMDYLKWIVVGFVIATPIAWYAMNQWLADFAYHIELQWWMFALAGLTAIVVSIFTVTTQTVRAAMTNPVDSVKSE